MKIRITKVVFSICEGSSGLAGSSSKLWLFLSITKLDITKWVSSFSWRTRQVCKRQSVKLYRKTAFFCLSHSNICCSSLRSTKFQPLYDLNALQIVTRVTISILFSKGLFEDISTLLKIVLQTFTGHKIIHPNSFFRLPRRLQPNLSISLLTGMRSFRIFSSSSSTSQVLLNVQTLQQQINVILLEKPVPRSYG